MKKLFALLLGIAIFSSLFFNNTVSYAAEKDNKGHISMEKKKYTNQELFDIISKSEYQKYEKTEKQGIYQYKKTELLDNTVESAEIYATMNISVITDTTNSSSTDNTKNNISVGAGGGSNYAYTYDGSITCMIYTTVYYTNSTGADGFDYSTISKITGGYNLLDTSFGIYSQSLSYGQTGTTYSSGKTSFSGTYTPSTSSWTTTPSGFQPIQVSTSISTIMGANYTVKIKRTSGTTIVTIPLENYVYYY